MSLVCVETKYAALNISSISIMYIHLNALNARDFLWCARELLGRKLRVEGIGMKG